MRLPDGIVESLFAHGLIDAADHVEVRELVSAALSPEVIRELACGPCPFCGGKRMVVADGAGPTVVTCPACGGHGSLLRAWLSEPAVLEAASQADRRWRVEPALSAAAGVLSERSGE